MEIGRELKSNTAIRRGNYGADAWSPSGGCKTGPCHSEYVLARRITSTVHGLVSDTRYVLDCMI